MNHPSSQIPIFLLLKTPDIINHFDRLFSELGRTVAIYENATEFLNNISSHLKAIIFIEDIIFQTEGTRLYETILERCPGSKIILVCRKNRRSLIREAMEKGSYGSIVEPYDHWEISTMVKHLLADLAEE